MSNTVSLKPQELQARAYVDRLILEQLTILESAIKLSELAERLSAEGVGLATVRSLLATNPERFAYHDRRWVPAARVATVGRPLHEIIRTVLDRFGAPMAADLLVTEVARVRHESEGVLRSEIDRIIDRDRRFFRTSSNAVGLSQWGFMATDESVERAYAVNGVSAEEVVSATEKLGTFDWHADDAVATAIGKLAPISLKVLGAVAWNAINPQDPRAVLTFDPVKFVVDALETPGYVLGADGILYPESEVKKWVSTAVKVADKLAPTIEVEDSAPIDVKSEDVERMVSTITSTDQTVTATRLLEELYEITPGSKTFQDDLANVMDALREDARVWWVGGDRFRKPDSAPDFVYAMPEFFQFHATEFENEEGERIDVELSDDGLSTSLRRLLAHPLAMDVNDEEVGPTPKQLQDHVRLVLKSLHRELGTFPLCQFPTGWLNPEPAIQELIFIDPDGREQQVWVNFKDRLMYNLIGWWYEQAVESGAVFSLTKTHKPNVYEFAWLDQADPVIFISSQRMEELRDIQTRAEDMSTLDILMAVMGAWPKGADFLTILSEVNVVRRSSRRLVASLLSSYQCFYQRSGSPVWHFDAKKVEQGFDKSKRKFVLKS